MCEMPQAFRPKSQSSPIRLFNPQSPTQKSAKWRINGHSASLVIWSVEEWERLSDRPLDAQYHPLGFWCALRLE
jgi:hypothetical protein